jgi:hypothetical protein
MWFSLFCLTFLAAAPAEEGFPEAPRSCPAGVAAQWTFTSLREYADPFNEVELWVVFTDPDGMKRSVPGFWAGKKIWRVRYSSSRIGLHRFRSECSVPDDAGLHAREGVVEVVEYQGENRLLRHGGLRVAADRAHLEQADGTPFLWLADTWWMGLSRRLHWPEEFQALAADRAAKGFNVVQIVAGLYPDMGPFDARGANEAGFPWTEDYGRMNPAYFDEADRRIAWLVRSEIVPCIVGAWGYHLPWLGVERMKKHWRYLVARYGAFPSVWCLAGEGIMPYYLSKDRGDAAFQKRGWTEVARYLREVDPFHRPLSIHPTDAARNQLEDPSLLDFDMLQTGHGDHGSIPNTVLAVRASRAARPPLPTIDAEVCYEGILGTCFEDVERFMIWSCLLSGAAGHTYGANGIWQVNRKDEPYGKSPHGGNWGNTPWDEAARLPGSGQVALAKRILERHPWQRFEPHPEWASFDSGEPAFAWGDWIWFPEGDPARDAPAARRFFRRGLEIPEGEAVARAVLRVAADDRFTAYLNGALLGSQRGWKPYREFAVGGILRPGRNVVAIEAENLPAPVKENPAGLIAGLEVRFAGGRKMEVLSGGDWSASDREEKGWSEPDFAESGWRKALSIARHGGGPWGSLDLEDRFMVPYAAGIPGKLRVIYLPLPRAAKVLGIEPGARYRAAALSPIDGASSDLGEAAGDASGSWAVPPPPAASLDRVLVLETR